MNETAEAVEQDNDPVSEWVTFELEGEKYGIDVMHVREVLKVSEITPVPGAPGFVVGIINLRGNVVTVLDTRRRFGLPPRDFDDATRIIILETDEEVLGMVVDSVAEVRDVRHSDIETAPNVGSDESARFIQGVTHQEGTLLILVDLQKFFGGE